jgi:hypothetical protein
MGLEAVDTAFDAESAKHAAPRLSIRLIARTDHQWIDHRCPSTDTTPHRVFDVDEVVSHRPSLPHLLHRGEELGVRLGLVEFVDEQFHRFDRRQRVEHLAEHPDAVEVFLGVQQLFLAGAALDDVDRREHALVHQLAVEVDRITSSMWVSLGVFRDFLSGPGGEGKRVEVLLKIRGRGLVLVVPVEEVHHDLARPRDLT